MTQAQKRKLFEAAYYAGWRNGTSKSGCVLSPEAWSYKDAVQRFLDLWEDLEKERSNDDSKQSA